MTIAPQGVATDVFTAGAVATIVLAGDTPNDPPSAQIGVGRLDDVAGLDLEGTRFIGITNPKGTFIVCLEEDATIQALIEMLEKLKRSPGAGAP